MFFETFYYFLAIMIATGITERGVEGWKRRLCDLCALCGRKLQKTDSCIFSN